MPPTLNEQIRLARGNKWNSARIKKNETQDIVTECLSQNPIKFKGAVWIDFVWELKTRKLDPLDNVTASLKYILDGMVKAGVIEEDNGTIIQSPAMHWFEYSKKGYKIKENSVMITISDHPHFLFERMVEYRKLLVEEAEGIKVSS